MARELIAAKNPAIGNGFKVAELENGATWGCVGQVMTAYQVPGAASETKAP